LIHQYGAWIVFALVFLESIGLPLPGEAILVSAAIFAGTRLMAKYVPQLPWASQAKMRAVTVDEHQDS
jgi:membrane protein DedA with SNARE-associated domain